MSLLSLHKKDKTVSQAGVGTSTSNLQNDNSQFKVVLDAIEDGVVLIDVQGVVQLINPAAAAMCGWKPDEATGINVGNVMQLVNEKGELINSNSNPFNQVFSSGQSQHNKDANLLNKSHQQIAISLKVSPLFDVNKKVVAAVAVFGNVSKERVEEQQRADFVSTASHEMRTPVAAIEGYLALALNNKVATIDERARSYIEKAHTSTQHLGQLFQDLLTSAKAEDGRLTSHPKVVEMGDFLQQLTSDLRLIAEKKGLFMDFVVGGTNQVIDATAKGQGGSKVVKPLYYVFVDADRLREVLTNLFDNAVKYTPEGKITIGLTGNEQVVQCYVRDTGPGIPPDDLPHLFQKFYRVDNSATRTIGGTGLGLFICKKIIELYNGRIWTESTLGQGSTFYINLPRLSSQKANQMQIAASSNTVITPNTPNP